MAKEETDIIHKWINNNRKWATLFRNHVIGCWVGHVESKTPTNITLSKYRHMDVGLMKGSGDFIGWRTITVTPDMVGKRVAVFTSVEAKTETGRVSDEQREWLHRVRQAGGIAMVVRSPDQVACDWEG